MPPEIEEVPEISKMPETTPERVIELIEEDPAPSFSVPLRKKPTFSVKRVVWTLVILVGLTVGAAVVAIAPMVGC